MRQPCGYILVGVEEENGIAKRPVKGLEPEQLDRIQREMQGYNNLIEPFYLPRPSVEEIDGRNILVIWIPGGIIRKTKCYALLKRSVAFSKTKRIPEHPFSKKFRPASPGSEG